MIKFVSAGAIAMLALAACAAPGQKDPVAEGFLDWDVQSKNFLFGRLITPSDLRHRAVIYLVVDANKFTNETVPDYASLPPLVQMPSDHMTQWETQELPREKILVVSVRNATKNLDTKTFAAVLRTPKNAPPTDSIKYIGWGMNKVPFYKDLKLVGEEELAADKLPYIAVYGGSGTEPLYTKEKWDPSDIKPVRAAVAKAVKGLGEWTAPLGVAEPEFFKKVAADIAKGKPAQNMLAPLRTGIKSKNPDQAREAQIMFDALNQYKSDLMLRIQLEFSSAPARAYYDYQVLVKAFPSEKKNLQSFEAKMKANKEIGALGKIFEKVMLWNRDDFVCKNAAEAKKNVLELQKIKKALEALANSQNAQIQGEAMLFQSQIDALIETMPLKVPQK